MPKSSPRQVAKAIIVDQGEALILHLEPEERKRRKIDEWHVPGGSEEPEDRSIEDTAIREAKEEIGLDIVIVRELGKASWSAFYEGEPAEFEATFVEARLANGESRDNMRIDTSEAEEGAWIKPVNYDEYPGLTEEARKYISLVLTSSEE